MEKEHCDHTLKGVAFQVDGGLLSATLAPWRGPFIVAWGWGNGDHDPEGLLLAEEQCPPLL